MEPSHAETRAPGRLIGMQMRRCFLVWLLGWAMTGAGLHAGAAVDDVAQGRAEAYQSAVRAVFAKAGWQIVREQPGRLVADHYLGFPAGSGTVMEGLLESNTTGVARVVITFEPLTATNTTCDLRAKRYNYVPTKKDDGRYTLTKPRTLKAPNIMEELAGMIGKARAQMLAAHPEYRAR